MNNIQVGNLKTIDSKGNLIKYGAAALNSEEEYIYFVQNFFKKRDGEEKWTTIEISEISENVLKINFHSR